MFRNPWISAYGEKEPQIHPEAFVDVSTRIIGEVQVEEGASLWPMAVLRADSAPIRIGRRSHPRPFPSGYQKGIRFGSEKKLSSAMGPSFTGLEWSQEPWLESALLFLKEP